MTTQELLPEDAEIIQLGQHNSYNSLVFNILDRLNKSNKYWTQRVEQLCQMNNINSGKDQGFRGHDQAVAERNQVQTNKKSKKGGRKTGGTSEKEDREIQGIDYVHEGETENATGKGNKAIKKEKKEIDVVDDNDDNGGKLTKGINQDGSEIVYDTEGKEEQNDGDGNKEDEAKEGAKDEQEEEEEEEEEEEDSVKSLPEVDFTDPKFNPIQFISKLFGQVKHIKDSLKKNKDATRANEKAIAKNVQSITSWETEMKSINTQIASANKDITEWTNRIDSSDTLIETLSKKVMDVNIYDLFKVSNDEEGQMSAVSALVQSLDKKIQKQLTSVGERLKKTESDVHKHGNEWQTTSIILDNIKLSLERIKTENWEKEAMNASFNYKPEPEVLEDPTKDHHWIDLEKQPSEGDIQSNIITNNEKTEGDLGWAENDVKLIQAMINKCKDWERTMKVNFNLLNIDGWNKRFAAIEQDIDFKISKIDLSEVYDKLRKLDTACKDNHYKNKLQDESLDKAHRDITTLISSMETSIMAANYRNNNTAEPGSFRGPAIDFTKFVDSNKWSENNKVLVKQIDQIRLDEEDLRRTLDDVFGELKLFVKLEKFEQFQESVKVYLEESKSQNNKRFADKIDTHKALKIIEVQWKGIADGSYKKDEAGENWLWAKKPISGYQCASCEATWQDWNQKYEYKAWNKYPNRDDKSHRMGHGFSRMLQMIDMDIIKTAQGRSRKSSGFTREINKRLNVSDDEEKVGSYGLQVKLPNVEMFKKGPMGQSLECGLGGMKMIIIVAGDDPTAE